MQNCLVNISGHSLGIALLLMFLLLGIKLLVVKYITSKKSEEYIKEEPAIPSKVTIKPVKQVVKQPIKRRVGRPVGSKNKKTS